MKKLINLFFYCSILVGCLNSEKQVNFEIYNSNPNYIFDLSISNGFNSASVDTLMPNVTKKILLTFKDVPRNDGGYKISYKSNGKKHFKNFGYYSNGVPSGGKYKIKIVEDSIQVNELFD